ncbi:TIGR01777 family oxidoreductase [Marinactinospora thermotolerans]|uniref:TIGR01777 family protein n=1 Tax=Marinactinospora thermotolerans DSM 45154 TaxID=1122192 RepID=A0A1T4MCC0_9ACTN|nr:TIGR01777 family oxidoreductase [Marinactinospora thermotolerans]SJZ64525.1 hypothetical protein SAMN02745673_01042 [Marinactinospora thermotolerans DSM 45154]
MRIAITGASGLIGTALSRSLTAEGHDVLHLVRRPARTAAEIEWSPEEGRVDTERLAGVEAVVHLAGAPIGPARWTARHRHRVRESRLAGTRTIATVLAAMDTPPRRLLCGSAIGFYGDTGTRSVGEDGPRGTGFLADLVAEWEAQTDPAERAGIPVAHLRTGVVLDRAGGILGATLPLFRLGLGGRLGDGRQYLSWISLADEVGAIRFLLERPDITGPVNLTAPGPVPNAVYTSTLARALHRPALVRVPGALMRAALDGFAEEAVLVSQRVVPERLTASGYSFHHPDIAGALSDIVGR